MLDFTEERSSQITARRLVGRRGSTSRFYGPAQKEKALRDVNEDLERIVAASATAFGWAEGDDAREIARASYALPDEAVIVEIGVFMGRCTILLAGSRRLRGSGKVHCVDPLDCSGDLFSAPFYLDELKATGKDSLDQVFWQSIASNELHDWVQLHKMTAQAAVVGWSQPVDLLLLDADQSPRAARDIYDLWVPFLKQGGTIVLRNTREGQYAAGHDGNRRLAVEELRSPRFSGFRQVGATTFAIKRF